MYVLIFQRGQVCLTSDLRSFPIPGESSTYRRLNMRTYSDVVVGGGVGCSGSATLTRQARSFKGSATHPNG